MIQYNISEKNNGLVITISGDVLGDFTKENLLLEVSGKIEKGGVNGVVDLSDARYINSSGLGILITLLTKFRNKGGDLVLVNPSEHISKLLMISKLNSIFTISPDLNTALESFK